MKSTCKIQKMTALFCAAALVVTMGLGCKKKKDDTAPQADVEQIMIPVKGAVAVKRDVTQSLNFSGNIDAFKRAAIAPAIPGSRVLRIFAEEGQFVQEGQMLIRLEDFQLRQVKANLDQLEVEYKRMETLKSRGSVTAQQYEQVSTQFQALKVQYEQLKNSVEVRAPFSGTVIGRNFNEGEVYNGVGSDGMPGILSVAQLGRMKIEVMVPEQDFVHLRPGQVANVRVEAFPDTVFEGKIFTVNPALNRMSRTSRVAIEIINNKQLLKPGMFAKVQIVTTGLKGVLAVPSTAVIPRDGQTCVFVVDNGTVPFVTKPRLVNVKTGLVTNELTQILEGLDEGAVVLTDNNISLSEKTGIRVTEIR